MVCSRLSTAPEGKNKVIAFCQDNDSCVIPRETLDDVPHITPVCTSAKTPAPKSKRENRSHKLLNLFLWAITPKK